MFADAVAKLAASIFPIFYTYEREDGPIIAVSGTGFFVDDSGLFVTVDHIMNCAPAGSTYYYYGNLPDQLRQPPVEIERIASEPRGDLFLGRVGRTRLRAVELSAQKVRPGDFVCLSGYPMADVSINSEGHFVANVRRFWQPTFVIDARQAVVDDKVYDGYIVDHPCFSGTSGGPVFDVEGQVRGMAVATVTRSEPELNGGLMTVKNGVILDAEHIRTFLERQGTTTRSTGVAK